MDYLSSTTVGHGQFGVSCGWFVRNLIVDLFFVFRRMELSRLGVSPEMSLGFITRDGIGNETELN